MKRKSSRSAPMPANESHAPSWQLIWSDEFEGDTIDPTKWDFDLGNGFFDYGSHQYITGWGNEELQYYTREPANVFVKDSVLHLRALKEQIHNCGYSSARMKTRTRDGAPLFIKQYGKFEFRASVPWGKGLWPALWLLPQEDAYGSWAASGEIDVMEIVGERPNEYLGTVHFGSTFPKRELVTHVYPFAGGSTVADFHVYSVEWEPGVIRWLVDGIHWATQNFWWSCSKLRNGKGMVAKRAADLNPWPAPFDKPFYIVMNVAVGGNFPGVPSPTTRFPAELLIDYVRVYDKVGGYEAVVPRGKGLLPYMKSRKRPNR